MFEFVPPSDIMYQTVFGLEPNQFEHSLINPARVKKIKSANDTAHKASKKSFCCIKYHVYDSVSYDDMRPWTDKIVIGLEDKNYDRFHFFIQILCLFSSFYYGSIAGIRYSGYDSFSTRNIIVMSFFEIMFIIHMLMQFLVSYKIEGEVVVRDIPMIASHYIQGQFLIELIPCIPF